MSLWFFVALVAYLVGVIAQWLELKQEFREMDEYNNFPIIWVAQVVLSTGCFLESLAWPCSLMLENAEEN